MHNTDKNKKGLSLTELLMAVTIAVLVISSVLAGWYYTSKLWAEERTRSRLRVNLEIAMERIKEEIRLSSTSLMVFYPEGSGPYDAVSFPHALADSNGFYTLDSNFNIVWNETIIYHVYNNPSDGSTELRRTVFNPRDNTLTQAQRYDQLTKVVANGDGTGAGTPNSQNASTAVVFKNLVDMDIMPADATFDLYSPSAARKNFDFGSIRLESGNHDFKFEVAGKNASSAGMAFGIDTLVISPSGGEREGEYYLPPYASSGDTNSSVFALSWSGNYYLNYNANAIGDFATLRLYYDMWIESNFNDSIRDNTTLAGSELYIRLDDPGAGEEVAWTAENEAGSQNGASAPTNDPVSMANINIRNVVSSVNMGTGGNLVRVKIEAHGDDGDPGINKDLNIVSAYLQERLSGWDGVEGTEIPLFFNDPAVVIGQEEGGSYGKTVGQAGVTSITIPEGHYVYSTWIQLNVDTNKDYLVTFYVSSLSWDTYWPGTEITDVNSYTYSVDVDPKNWSGTSDWPDTGPIVSPNIYAAAALETWTNQGTVTSRIYDTKLSDPNYNQIRWSAYKPSGSDIVVKARSSDDKNMTGATDFALITGSSANPHLLGIGLGRYVQFQAVLSKSPPYDAYNNYPTIDDVAIDWPGQTRICDISGFMTQRPDYGIIKLTVDGMTLTKALNFNMEVYDIYMEKTYTASLTAETEPRNTGR